MLYGVKLVYKVSNFAGGSVHFAVIASEPSNIRVFIMPSIFAYLAISPSLIYGDYI
jgi:hypothetical protein